MKRVVFIVIALCVHLLCLAQSKERIGTLKRINDSIFIQIGQKSYKANPKVITVKLKSGIDKNKLTISKVRSNKLGYIDILLPDDVDMENYVLQLEKTGYYDVIEYNNIGEYCVITNDLLRSSQWYLNSINVNTAWDITMGHSNIIVAVLDSGTDWMHFDIGNGNDNYKNIDESSGWNFISNNSNVITTNGHGTRVAGIIGAKSNNSLGISGISGGNNLSGVTIIPVCVGVNEPDAAILDDAIIYAVDNGARIIQLSLGVGQTNAINDAITYAAQNNVTIICASGNGYNSSVNYPSSHTDVMAVGAINQSNVRADFSNYGTGLDVVAPGVNILSTTLNDNYDSQDGTSFAAPIVAGIAALLLSVRPDLTQAQVRQAIESTCTKLSGYSFSTNSSHPNGTWNNQVGHGLVNAYAALSLVAPTITGSVSNCSTTATFTVNNAPAGYTWGHSSSLTLVSQSGNTATFSKNTGGISEVSVSIIVGGVTVASKSFVMGTVPDISSITSVTIGCEYGTHFGYIPNSTVPSNQGINQFEWHATTSNITIEPHPAGYIHIQGDHVRILTDSYVYGGIEIRAHNTCGWSSWQWVAALSPCSSYYSMSASPNPVNTTLNINITSNENALQSQSSQSQVASAKRKTLATGTVYEIKLFTNTGSQVRQATAQDTGNIALNVSDLPNGLYILYIHDGSDNPPHTQNIIVAH
jgi:subtilisin family serine protease